MYQVKWISILVYALAVAFLAATLGAFPLRTGWWLWLISFSIKLGRTSFLAWEPAESSFAPWRSDSQSNENHETRKCWGNYSCCCFLHIWNNFSGRAHGYVRLADVVVEVRFSKSLPQVISIVIFVISQLRIVFQRTCRMNDTIFGSIYHSHTFFLAIYACVLDRLFFSFYILYIFQRVLFPYIKFGISTIVSFTASWKTFPVMKASFSCCYV